MIYRQATRLQQLQAEEILATRCLELSIVIVSDEVPQT
jgi:hypothetical protein